MGGRSAVQEVVKRFGSASQKRSMIGHTAVCGAVKGLRARSIRRCQGAVCAAVAKR
jgi:hypothetical protein